MKETLIEPAGNSLWRELFGLLFWSELSARAPGGVGFYRNNEIVIEEKLASLRDFDQVEKQFLRTVGENFGRPNDFFKWHPDLLKRSLTFLKWAQNQDIAQILRYMAQNFSITHSGFPDFVTLRNQQAVFLNVKKAKPRSAILSKDRLLNEAGFETEMIDELQVAPSHQVYVVVDVETTGGSSATHRVTEIGAVKIQDGKIIDEFQTLLNPERLIPRWITQVTGISNEMVADAPLFSEVAEKFNEFTKDAVFVAHNARFDYGFIRREFARVGAKFERPTLCTVSESRKAFPGLGSYSLKNLTDHFQISLENHHRALCDARAAAQLLLICRSTFGFTNKFSKNEKKMAGRFLKP